MSSDQGAEQRTSDNKKPTMPKGGKKGGKIFPRIGLEQALAYSKRLVSKTAITPQPESTVLAGVFDNAGSVGKIRLSALKQFGLIEGNAKAYNSSLLAKNIETAGDEGERLPFIRQAFFSPVIFQELYNTFQGDQATKARIRGRAQQVGVHPDSAEGCTELFVSSILTARLASVEGDAIRLAAAAEVNQQKAVAVEADGNEQEEPEPSENQGAPSSTQKTEQAPSTEPSNGKPQPPPDASIMPRPRTAADVSINLTVDSSLDGDKLEKHLNLLRRFGLI